MIQSCEQYKMFSDNEQLQGKIVTNELNNKQSLTLEILCNGEVLIKN